MDAYAKRISDLAHRYTDHWGVISVADNVCRTEKWARLKRQFDKAARDGRPVEHWNPTKPWSTLIVLSAIGQWARDYWRDGH